MSVQILRKIVGGESFPTRDRGDGWMVWDDDESLKPEDAEAAIICYIDIHECDGDPPSAWRAEVDGKIVREIDAREMTSAERTAACDDIREEGREILGKMIKNRVDETLERIKIASKRLDRKDL